MKAYTNVDYYMGGFCVPVSETTTDSALADEDDIVCVALKLFLRW